MKSILILAGICLSFPALLCDKTNPTSSDETYTLTISSINGSVIKSPDKSLYMNGDIVMLTAIADSGYSFFKWSGDANGTSSTTSITMNGNKSVTAIFIIDNTNEKVTDADGNVYTTVKIGNQVWTVENLRTTKYNDGTEIPHIITDSAWYYRTTPAYCYHSNTTDTNIINKIGALYNWYTILTDKLAPAGWHVPDDMEWKELEDYLVLNGYNWDGSTDTSRSNKIAKALAAATDWFTYTGLNEGTVSNDLTKNNRTGFTALPCGWRKANGGFTGAGRAGSWWSASGLDMEMAWGRDLQCDSSGINRYFDTKSCGASVRLLKNK